MIDPGQSLEGDGPVPGAGSAQDADPMVRPSVWPRGRVARNSGVASPRRASRSGPPPRVVAAGQAIEPLHVIADLTASVLSPQADQPLRSVESGRSEGSRWEQSTQGWVRTNDGGAQWRTILTTADAVARYSLGTHLGIATGEAAVTVHGDDTRHLGGTLLRAREVAVDGMTHEAVARGAHAVVGVSIAYTPFAGTLLVTATGTAVTLTLATNPQHHQ